MKCDREQQVIEATRDGLWSSSLAAHLRDCAHCTQTELIAASLQEDAAKAKRVDLPPASLIWRRAQSRRREAALELATRRPFLIAGGLGAVYSMVLLLWGIFQLPQSVYRSFVAPSGLTGNLALAGVALSTILAIIGSFVFLLETRR